MTEDTTACSPPSSRAEVERAMRELVVRLLVLDGIGPDDIDANAEDFLTALGANSVDALEIIITAEEMYGIEFKDDEINFQLVRTLNHFVDAICSKLQSRG
ncbi:MAG TPA: phosphopantetheine-binding protein [Rhizomicrobium sp.]|nr:phosphopantetheine-binding protein [Rhizomicrobium sp.]